METGQVFRNSDPARIAFEVEDSLMRLQTDSIDLYFVHWPESAVPFEETARLMQALKDPIGPDFMAPPPKNDAGLDLSNSPEINLEKKV